jgi:hypothetical protein
MELMTISYQSEDNNQVGAVSVGRAVSSDGAVPDMVRFRGRATTGEAGGEILMAENLAVRNYVLRLQFCHLSCRRLVVGRQLEQEETLSDISSLRPRASRLEQSHRRRSRSKATHSRNHETGHRFPAGVARLPSQTRSADILQDRLSANWPTRLSP